MASAKVGFYGHVRQYHNLQKEIDGALHEVLESGVYTLGPKVKQFEEELARYSNHQEAIGVNSGTDALWLVFLALGIGAGDEVITTANTFFATAEAIWLAGATPVFVDIEPKTCNMDTHLIEAALSPRTRAIVPVHLYGQTADMRAVWKIAKAHNLAVVEDCAQAIGARGDDFAIGENSDAVALSFITAKNLGCFGDGGALLTNRPEIAQRVRKLRNHGSLKRSYHSVGYNSRLDELQAAVLSVKLQHLDEWNDLRRARARDFDEALTGTWLKLPYARPGYRHVYHLYVVETDDRDGLQAYLGSQGITALTHYPIAIHQQEGFPWGRHARVSGSLKHTERSAARVLSLPMYPELTSEELKVVAEGVRAWESQAKKKTQVANTVSTAL
jgi:dTDP-4-amino-4,6-dideoxygalactose transaminase